MAGNATTKEQFEQEMQSVSKRNGFKLVDFQDGKEIGIMKTACPIRFEGKGLLGKRIIVHIPKSYCFDGEITQKSREKLGSEGYCGYAERSKELYGCSMVFKANDSNQWKIEIVD